MAKIAFLKKLLPEMVKNRHFLPFFGPKTPFFAIFWHPVYPPSKTPFLAVLPPPDTPHPRAGRGGLGPQIFASQAPSAKRSEDKFNIN
jgi:hypothetical protein